MQEAASLVIQQFDSLTSLLILKVQPPMISDTDPGDIWCIVESYEVKPWLLEPWPESVWV